MFKRTVADLGQPIGDSYAFQMIATCKCTEPDLFDTVRQGNGLDRTALEEHVPIYVFYPFGYRDIRFFSRICFQRCSVNDELFCFFLRLFLVFNSFAPDGFGGSG